MPPPRPSTNSLCSSNPQSRFGPSSSKNVSKRRAEISTSTNTSNSRSASSYKSRGTSNSRTGQSSNLSSTSDARKPRRKRRPKKKKQQVCMIAGNGYAFSKKKILILDQLFLLSQLLSRLFLNTFAICFSTWLDSRNSSIMSIKIFWGLQFSFTIQIDFASVLLYGCTVILFIW